MIPLNELIFHFDEAAVQLSDLIGQFDGLIVFALPFLIIDLVFYVIEMVTKKNNN